jgi:hypothetical protein
LIQISRKVIPVVTHRGGKLSDALKKLAKLASLFVLVAVGLVTTATLPATAAVANPGRHCVTGINKVQPGQTVSTIAYRHCANTLAAALQQSPRTDWLLETFYEDAYYNEDNPNAASDTVMGTQGDCDAAGYTLTLTIENAIVNGISSYTYGNSCDGSDGFYWANKTSACWWNWHGNNPHIGPDCNDHLWSMNVYKAY